MTTKDRPKARLASGADMATLYSRKTAHDSRPKRTRTRGAAKAASLKDWR